MDEQQSIGLIKASVKRGVPDMADEAAQEVSEYLYRNDFKTVEDLVLVKFDDLRPQLSLGHSRKLISYWERSAASTSQQARQRSQQSSYSVPWNQIGLSEPMLKNLNTGEILKESDTDLVVRLVVDHVKLTVPNVSRNFLPAVAGDMAAKFPNAFKDIVVRGKNSENLSTVQKLTYKMQNRFDNQKRKPDRTDLEVEAPNLPQAYGCTRWQVLELPNDETIETLEEKKQELKDHFQSTSRNNWDWRRKIRPLLETTYALQRRDINSQVKKKKRTAGAIPDLTEAMNTDRIREEWPFLFVFEGIIHHFKILTGKDYKEELSAWLPEVKDDLVDFLAKTTEQRKIRKECQQAIRHKTGTDPELIALVLMLMSYFGETPESIMKVIPGPTAIERIPHLVTLPPGPFIVGEGKTWFHAKKFYFSVDGAVRGSASTFARALGLLFCSFYMLNIQYTTEAAKLLDFIQRCVIGINPDKGSRAPGSSRNKKQIAFKILQLNSKFEAYRRSIAVEEEENDVDGELDDE